MLNAIKGLVADLARPAAIWSLSAGCTVGLLEPFVTSDKLGLALTALGAMYAAKAAENASAGKHSASVEVAKAQASGPAPAAPTVYAPDANITATP